MVIVNRAVTVNWHLTVD